jgi:hypothetical protein
MTEQDKLIQRVLEASDDPSFRDELLRALSAAHEERTFRPEFLRAANHDELLAFRHQALGMMFCQDYANYHGEIIFEVAGAALEDANYHREAETVLAMAGGETDCERVVS